MKANIEGTEDCGCLRLDGYSTETITPEPIKKERKKANFEEDLIASSIDVGRTGRHEDCG